MEAVLNHGVEYEITDSVSVEDLVKSIEANARLMRASGNLLSELVPGLTLDVRKISVLSLSQQSPLKELFALSIFITYQDELEQEVPDLITSLTGSEIPDEYDKLVTVLVMLVAIYGISKAFDLLFPGRSSKNLQETQQSLISRAASILSVSSQRILAALEILFTGRSRRSLVNASQKMFAPTRNYSGALIKSSGGEILVPQSATRDAQSAAGLPFAEEVENAPMISSEMYRNVRIILHAMDKDRNRRGWAGHCPDLFDERIPMHLEKTLKPESIFGKDEIRGDILLMSEENDEGIISPKEFLLIQTIE